MISTATSLQEAVWASLREVADPEIPAVSVVDMGMVERVEIDGDEATITILPTFTGCPAIDVITSDVRAAVEAVEGVTSVRVETTFSPPWTSDRITSEGRTKLKEFGLAPPTGEGPVLLGSIGLPTFAICPFCNSKNTVNENPFGPTPCRALYHCNDCKNPFEQFKPV